jgi:lipopolysaccharide export system permease protein
MIFRYLFKELLKSFLFFVLCLFLFFSLADIATNPPVISKEMPIIGTLLYHLCQFVQGAEFLLPLALVVSTIKVLLSLNCKYQLLALQVAGISAKKISLPFFAIAFAISLFNLLSWEYIYERSHQFADRFHKKHHKSISRDPNSKPLRFWYLQDGSKLVFQSYDPKEGNFTDLFWVKNASDFWHMKSLHWTPDYTMGNFVDRFGRNDEGELIKTESFELHSFPDLKWESEMPRKGFIPVYTLAISKLRHFLKDPASSYRKSEVATQFFYKLATPLFPLIAIIAIIPFCVSYSRQHRFYLIYLFAIAALLLAFTVMHALTILGENGNLPPTCVILVPIAVASLFFVPRFIKMS